MTDKLIKIAVCWITNAAALYLGGAFAAANFDINTWDGLGRGIIGMAWVTLAAAATTAIFMDAA